MSTLNSLIARAGRFREKQAFKAVYRRHREATMLNERAYVANLRLVVDWMKSNDTAGGSVVECGTWRGGMLCGLVETCTTAEELHAFDSFQGLPPTVSLDGEEPARLQAAGALVAGNNVATIQEVRDAIDRLPAPQAARVEAHAGWFTDTLPGFRPQRPIAIH